MKTIEVLEFCLQESHVHGWWVCQQPAGCQDALGISGVSAAAVVQETPAAGPARCLLGTVELEELSSPRWGTHPRLAVCPTGGGGSSAHVVVLARAKPLPTLQESLIVTPWASTTNTNRSLPGLSEAKCISSEWLCYK